MKYIFLEKTSNCKSPVNYYYFITNDKNLIYADIPKEDKESIYFDIHTLTPLSFEHNSKNGLEKIFGEIFIYIIHNNLLNKKILKFSINDNIIKAE